MKRTDLLTTIIAIVLFVALGAYIMAYATDSGSSVVTAQALATDFDIGGVATGIVVRQEEVLESGEKYVDISVRDGTKVAAGEVLATSISSEAGLERANRINELELEISRVSSALEKISSADDITSRNEALTSAVDRVAAAVATHDLDGLDEASLNISALLFGQDAEGASEENLAALQRELDSLMGSESSDTTPILSSKSGTFSSTVDGFEGLEPGDLNKLTPSKLEDLMDSGEDVSASAFGKLVTGHKWYFAAVMGAQDASNLAVGRTARLNFGRYYGSDVYAVVDSMSEPENGSVAIVFECDTALAETIAMRAVSASVVFDEYSGIRIPSQAIRVDDENQSTYVWTVTAMQVERKDVTVIYGGDGFVIVERDSTPDALREGNTVIVSGKNIYEGKVLK